MRGAIILGWACIGFLLIFLGGWAGLSRVDTTISTAGIVLTDPPPRDLQALVESPLAEVLVTDGQRVSSGQILLKFDTTELRRRVQLLDNQIAALNARRDRLTAESMGVDEFAAEPLDPAQRIEAAVYAANKSALLSTHATMAAQIHELEAQEVGAIAERGAVIAAIDLIVAQKSRAEPLVAKGVVPHTELEDIASKLTAAQGQLGRLNAVISQAAAGKMTLLARIDQLSAEQKQIAATELAALAPQLAALQTERASIDQQLDMATVRAPTDGTVQFFGSAYPGQLLARGQKILTVIPSEAEVFVQSQIAPDDIAQVAVGQLAFGWLTGPTGQDRTPIHLALTKVSADRIITDEGSYFAADFGLSNPDIAPDTLKIGQPVSVMIRTARTSPLAYLTGPLAQYVSGIFRSG